MKRGFLLLGLFAAACISGQYSSCWTVNGPDQLPGDVRPIATPTPLPTPSASPSPSPSPTPVVLNCRVDFLRVTGPEQIQGGQTGSYDLTPMQIVDGASQPVPDPCNEPLASSVNWSIKDPLLGFVAGDGFSATVNRYFTRNPFPSIEPMVLRVEFKGIFAEKVIL